MIKAVLIDDEQHAVATLMQVLHEVCTNIEVVGTAGNVAKGAATIETYNPDLVFLDIQMPDGTGFDLLKKFTQPEFAVIFVTAYEEYALQALKSSALDYILKPFDPEEIQTACKKAAQVIDQAFMQTKLRAFFENMENLSRDLKKIVLRTAESVHLVNIQDIVHCEADGNYTRIRTNDGKSLYVSKTLKEYHDLLKNCGFFRAHQSHLVNLNYMDFFNKEKSELHLKNHSTVPVSLRKKEELFRRLSDF